MKVFSRANNFALSVALFAILMNTFAPVVSRTLAAWRGGYSLWAEIHFGGDAALGGQHDHHNPTHDPKHPGNHCGFCVAHAGSFGLTPSAPATLLTVGAVAAAPIPSYQEARRSFFRSAAQPRAPPFLS